MACAAFDATGGGGAGQAGDIVTFEAATMEANAVTYKSAVASSSPAAIIAACGQNGLSDPKTSVPGLGQHRVEANCMLQIRSSPYRQHMSSW